jgi:hypothetical protein
VERRRKNNIKCPGAAAVVSKIKKERKRERE